MKREWVKSWKESLQRRLIQYNNLFMLDEQLVELFDSENWDEFDQVVEEKEMLIARIEQDEKDFVQKLKDLLPILKVSNLNWNDLYATLSKEEQLEIEPLVHKTQGAVLKLQEYEIKLRDKFVAAKNNAMDQLNSIKQGQKARNAYEATGAEAVFIDKLR